jgi:hypothetical protein
MADGEDRQGMTRQERLAQQAARAYDELQKFSLAAENSPRELFGRGRELVLEAARLAEDLSPRANELIGRLKEADRHGKFAKAFRVLRDYLATCKTARTSRGKTLSLPHPQQVSVSV